MTRLLAILAAAAAASAPAGERYTVNPDAGNNALSAVFDAPLGERITAISAQVGCELSLDTGAGTASGHCSVPLTSLKVDGDDTKTEHFQQWATNKKVEPADCRFELRLDGVKLEGPLVAQTPVAFTGLGTFTICGRARTPSVPEKLTGTAVLFPAGSYGSARTIRIRARVDGFDREAYGISPRNTEGWLARVQQLAPVVAARGQIDVSLFAKMVP